jgi:hypothetical protein
LEWEHLLCRLIEDEALRNKLGREGRQTVEKFYSVRSNENRFLRLFT